MSSDDASPPSERHPERLNWLGQAVQAGGILHRWTRHTAHALQTRTTAIAQRSKKAFYEGLDPNIDEATIISEDASEDTDPKFSTPPLKHE